MATPDPEVPGGSKVFPAGFSRRRVLAPTRPMALSLGLAALRGDLRGAPAHNRDADGGEPEAGAAIGQPETARVEDLEDAHSQADDRQRGHGDEAGWSVERLRPVGARVREYDEDQGEHGGEEHDDTGTRQAVARHDRQARRPPDPPPGQRDRQEGEQGANGGQQSAAAEPPSI